MAKVLILGGGFAGLEAAIHLRKNKFDVTLVSNRDYFYIYPTSIWIPTGEITSKDAQIPLQDLANKHGFELIVDPVISFEAATKKTTLKSGKILEGFDYVVLAMGQDKMKAKGIENTLSICGPPEQATDLYTRIDALLKKGSGTIAMGFGGNPKDPSAVRGGPAFELLFNVDTYLRKKRVRENFELIFFAPMAQPGKKMGEKALIMMEKMFKAKNITRKVGTKIKAFDSEGILFADETKIEADLVMFISAGTGHGILRESGLPISDAGFVVTNAFCEVEGFDTIYSAGDSASLMGPKWKAKQGHVAEVMARNVAHNILLHTQNKTEGKKSYIEHLNILCVMDTGDGAAFVQRDDKGAKIIPMPIFGHWMKKGWGWYFRNSKLGKFPRLPGM